MLSKLTAQFYLPGQYNDVRDWCHTCATCASRKSPSNKPWENLQFIQVGAPMQLISMDILGPLQAT